LYLLVLLWGVSIDAKELRYSQEKTEMSRGDVKIIEATENIRYLSQKIAKEYFFLYTYPENSRTKKNLYKTLTELSKNLQAIASVTKDADTQNILEFLAYSKEEILNLLKQKPTKEQAILMLDYSETLLEGADSIGRTYAYAFSKEEEMLVASKNLAYLLERIMKYYMALYHHYNTQSNTLNLYKAVTELKYYLSKVNRYHYPKNVLQIRKKINMVWHRDSQILGKIDQYFIPLLMADSVIYLEKNIDLLAGYHSQNL